MNKQAPERETAMNSRYAFDAGSGVWLRHDNSDKFVYSDGDEVEERIAGVLRDATDLSLFSTELAAHHVDWPSIYHLSPTRANLLRPLDGLLRGARVLEVGAGCGAITRYLGEAGAQVTALEGSMRRASIVASRCRDLDNVRVIYDRFDQADLEHGYDVVTLIGVLEYARIYGSGADPVQDTLERARRLLNEGGVLIIAIENQLGLKYFAGLNEDHLGRPMAGIEDHYDPSGVVTFGRAELDSRLRQAGFENVEFALPFPDYKLPISIVLPAALDKPGFSAAGFASQAVGADQQARTPALFSMPQVFDVLGRNKLLADLANSFLVLAGKSGTSPGFARVAPGMLAAHYSSNRLPGFAKSSIFVERADGVQVCRRWLCESDKSLRSTALISQNLEDEPYIPGVHWGQALESIISRAGWTSNDVAEWLSVWLEALRKSIGLPEESVNDLDFQVPGIWFDAMPRNLIRGESGSKFFDLEWVAKPSLSWGFLLYRGLSDSLISVTRIAPPAQADLAHVPTLIRAVMRSFGILITQAQIESHYDMDAAFQDEIMGLLRRAPAKATMDEFWLPIAPEIGAMLQGATASTSELTTLSGDLVRTREAYQQAQLQIDADASHILRLELRVGEAETQLEATRGELEAQQDASQTQLEAIRVELEGQLDASQTQLEAVRAELEGQLDASKTQLEAIRVELEGQMDASQTQLEALLASTGAQFEAHGIDTKALQSELDDKDNEIHRLWALIDASNHRDSEMLAARDEANQLLAQMGLSTTRATTTRPFVDDLVAQLSRVEQSRSWRLTLPFRKVGGRVRSVLGRLRRAAYLGVGKAYRSMPPRTARRIKDLVFRSTGPLFSSTGAYQRWRAEWGLRGNWPTALPHHAAHEAQQTEPPANILWYADGHREWTDYVDVRERIDAGLRRNDVAEPKPLKLLKINEADVSQAITRIQLPPPGDAPDVSILVPAYNHLTTTLECLASIAASIGEGEPSFEVIVADDASTDDSGRILAGIPNIRVIIQPENIGFLLNCNSAAAHARGRYLLLLNNDVQVTPGWLSALVRCYESTTDAGAVGPKIVYPSGWLQEAGTRLRRDGTSEMIGLNDDPARTQYSYRRNVDYCSGACLMVAMDDFHALEGFDSLYAPAYCEDSDLCMRLRGMGKQIVYCPDSVVVHHLSRTSDGMQSDYKLSCIATNLAKFSERWRPQLDALDDVRTIAFYLPQFHPFPENDLWWGKGFTEWTNVTRAKPNFVGHYQPRVPADLGYYDLRLSEVMEQQAELARRYGVGGFCYYYYWFAGKRLLERPIEQMLESGRPDFPFCLCWANENWTRRWDGNDRDVLMAQHHSDQDDEAVIRDLMRYFGSRNYIRVNGKPLILVYRVTLFPNFARTAMLWRTACRDAGIGEIYIVQVESFELATAGIRPEDMGCDAATEFPPQGMASPYPLTAPLLNEQFEGAVADYRDLAVRYATRDFPGYKRFMGAMPGWDNTARRQNNSYCFENATPGAFQAWLETAVTRTKQQYSGDERLIFINAWNEWAEGAYLEPDRRFGHAFLQAHANAKDAGLLVRHETYSLG